MTQDMTSRKMETPKICWRMSKFVHSFYPKTKLSEAAVFSKENIANYDDVFTSWEALCNTMASAALDAEVDIYLLGGIASMRTSGETVENMMKLLGQETSTEVKMAVNVIAVSNGEEEYYNLN